MSDSTPEPEEKEEELREIPKWAERYAGSRLLPSAMAGGLYGIVLGAIISGLMLVIMVPAMIIGIFTNHLGVLWVGMGLWVAACAIVIYVVNRNARSVQTMVAGATGQIAKTLYEGEGAVLPVPGATVADAPPMWVRFAVVLPFAAGMTLPALFHVALRWQQPISALGMVPLACLWVWLWAKGRMGSALHLLVPALYFLEALLILAGVPLYSTWLDPVSNLMLSLGSCVGLGLITAHVYNRYALRRLRRLAVSPEAEEGEGHGGA